jgi:hypothetical protein
MILHGRNIDKVEITGDNGNPKMRTLDISVIVLRRLTLESYTEEIFQQGV